MGRKKRDEGMSPAISSIIITSVIIVLLLIVIVFANSYLNDRLAANEFNTLRQFMQSIGLQVDDVAWTIGRTQTTKYASQFGIMNFESLALNYTIFIDNVPTFNYSVGILLFNMPVNRYTISDNYYERISPSTGSRFLHTGTSAPVTNVYVIQKMPMADGNYVRIVVSPSIRMLNSTIIVNGNQTNYYKFYLPILAAPPGAQPRYSQSITLESTNLSVQTTTVSSTIKITVSFPKSSSGFNSGFFSFSSSEENIVVPAGSTVQFYAGSVTTLLGLYA
jgi:hypothetical protein